jgi:hypothetical protein
MRGLEVEEVVRAVEEVTLAGDVGRQVYAKGGRG